MFISFRVYHQLTHSVFLCCWKKQICCLPVLKIIWYPYINQAIFNQSQKYYFRYCAKNWQLVFAKFKNFYVFCWQEITPTESETKRSYIFGNNVFQRIVFNLLVISIWINFSLHFVKNFVNVKSLVLPELFLVFSLHIKILLSLTSENLFIQKKKLIYNIEYDLVKNWF